jgi:hypothetical protein
MPNHMGAVSRTRLRLQTGRELALPWHAQQIPSTLLIRSFACLRVGSQVAVCAISGRRWNCSDQVIDEAAVAECVSLLVAV